MKGSRQSRDGRVGGGTFLGWQTQPAEGEQITECQTQVLKPCERTPPDADAVTQHPDADLARAGYRIAWKFPPFLILLAVMGILGVVVTFLGN